MILICLLVRFWWFRSVEFGGCKTYGLVGEFCGVLCLRAVLVCCGYVA